jgi:hypothetical protein
MTCDTLDGPSPQTGGNATPAELADGGELWQAGPAGKESERTMIDS